jgi:cytochrome c-type biogenesis protein
VSDQVSLIAALVGGFLSFISPCVLPLIPGYVSFVSGATLEEMRGEAPASGGTRQRVLLTSLAFVLGFSLVFVALGATASALGQFLSSKQSLLEKIAGVIVVVLGLHTMGAFRIALLETEKRVQTQRKPAGPLGAVVVGIAFAFGWTPCISPILGSILLVASGKETVLEGVTLLSVYSMGLGIPFLLTAVAIDRFFAFSNRIRKHYHAIELVSGGLLVVLGVLIFSGQLTAINRFLQPYLPAY